MSYPKWLYHETEPAKIVQTNEEHDSLVGRWEETPAAFNQEQAPQTREQTENQKKVTSEHG